MIPALFGNHELMQNLETMASGSRMPQCFLFYGASGVGKKTLAGWLAARLLCTQTHHAPCGVCKNCRTIAEGIHPDVIHVPHSGKLGGFSVDTVRQVCADALIAPNGGQRKIYLFEDCDAMDVRSQNILLKRMEEPPPFAVFIFTAGARSTLLPTVCSRLVPMAVSPCTEQEALDYLIGQQGFSQEAAQRAVQCFHGNIGDCLNYLNQGALEKLVSLAQTAVRCIIEKNEYELLRTFYAAGTERPQIRQLLSLLDAVLRDALVLRLDGSAACIGCDAAGAGVLAAVISESRAQQWHGAIDRAYRALAANVNVSLLMSALCAEIMA